MTPPTTTRRSSCSQTALVEFLDGELTADREEEVAAHIASCPTCQSQLNEQKEVLAELDDSFSEVPELPDDFSKIVSINAQSQVSGVRRPYERRTALTVCFVLLSIVLAAVAFGPLNAFLGPAIIFEKIAAVAALGFGLLSDVVLGLGIVGRAVSSSLGISPLIIIGLVIGSVLVLMIRRTQKSTRVSSEGRTGR
jgi:anti-sigma factor RsiW